MQFKKRLFVLLFIYTFQVSVVPFVHYLEESGEKDCPDIHAFLQLNSTCDDGEWPCRNPAHHHHNRHEHDHSQCLICKSFSQDIECHALYSAVYPDSFKIASYSPPRYSPLPLSELLSCRSPPVANVVT